MTEVGDRIKMLSNHWCRPNHEGVIVQRTDLPEPGDGRFLVYFDKQGVGLDGRLLFVSEADFKVMDAKHSGRP